MHFTGVPVNSFAHCSQTESIFAAKNLSHPNIGKSYDAQKLDGAANSWKAANGDMSAVTVTAER